MTEVTLTRNDLKLAVKHLKDGRALLSKRGVWIKGAIEQDGWKKVCSLGALYKVSGKRKNGNATNIPAVLFLDCAIDGGNPFCVGGHIVKFNDHSSTTKTQLLSKWDDAIKLAETALAKVSPKTP